MSDLPPRGRLAIATVDFLRDERGGATIWSLLWLIGFAIMAGLAIDSTNGYRNKAMLQSTADVAALAGVIDLPSPYREVPYDPTPGAYDSTVKASAILFADKNQKMDAAEYGSYMETADIEIGNWDIPTRIFTPGKDFSAPDELTVNAVRVEAFLDQETRANGVPTALLHIIGTTDWQISVDATAIVGTPSCIGNKVQANDEICVRSNNYFYSGQCFHGEDGVNFRNNNTWEMADSEYTVAVSSNGTDNVADSNYENGMPSVHNPYSDPTSLPQLLPSIGKAIMGGDTYYLDTATQSFGNTVYTITTDTIGSNFTPPSAEGAWLETGVQLASLDGFASIVSLLAAAQAAEEGGDGDGLDAEKDNNSNPGCNLGSATGTLLPPYTDGTGNLANDLFTAIGTDGSADGGTWDFTTDPALDPGNIYFYNGNKKLTINGDLEGVTIVSTQEITVSNGSVIQNSVLFSMDGIQLGKGVQIGEDDGCDPGGGTKLLAMHEIDSAADLRIFGSFFVSGGHIGIAAQANGIQGLAARSEGNTTFTSNSAFGPVGEEGESDAGACDVDFFIHESELGYRLVD